jgi:hypothetical protein
LIGLGWPLDRPRYRADPDAARFGAILAFQEAAGVKVDGWWGPKTQLVP